MNFEATNDILLKFSNLRNKVEEIRPCTLIFCADHGVSAENVSAYPKSTTAQMVRNYLEFKGAAANAFASFANSNLRVIDVGVDADVYK